MSRSSQATENESPDIQLKRLFRRNGYMRVPNKKRIKKLGRQKYKKGYEVRLVAASPAELSQIRRMLRQVGFKPANPFHKGQQIAQPIYGKAAVEWFKSAKLK